MGNLLKKISRKERKSLLRETTLTDDDSVYLSRKLDSLFLTRDGHLYWIKKKFSKIDYSDPRVSLKYVGETTEPFLEISQPYRELRNSS